MRLIEFDVSSDESLTDVGANDHQIADHGQQEWDCTIDDAVPDEERHRVHHGQLIAFWLRHQGWRRAAAALLRLDADHTREDEVACDRLLKLGVVPHECREGGHGALGKATDEDLIVTITGLRGKKCCFFLCHLKYDVGDLVDLLGLNGFVDDSLESAEV